MFGHDLPGESPGCNTVLIENTIRILDEAHRLYPEMVRQPVRKAFRKPCGALRARAEIDPIEKQPRQEADTSYSSTRPSELTVQLALQPSSGGR
jgi:hypothetical protein